MTTSAPGNQTPTALETFFMEVTQLNGVRLPQRPIYNFLGGSVTDDPVNNRTNIQLGGTSTGFANLTANFTMPAVGANALIQVNASAGYPTGVDVFIAGAGFMLVEGTPDGTHLTVQNTGGPYNVSPGTSVTGTPLIVPSGPPNLLLEIADALVTQRPTIDFRGFVYADDAANGRAIITAPGTAMGSPGATITGPYTVLATDQWKLFDATTGPVAFTFPGSGGESASTVGLIRRFSHIAGNGTGGVVVTFNGNGAQVGKLDGTLGTLGTVSGTTPAITYKFAWDGTVYRCVN